MDGDGSRIMKRHDLDTLSFDTFSVVVSLTTEMKDTVEMV